MSGRTGIVLLLVVSWMALQNVRMDRLEARVRALEASQTVRGLELPSRWRAGGMTVHFDQDGTDWVPLLVPRER